MASERLGAIDRQMTDAMLDHLQTKRQRLDAVWDRITLLCGDAIQEAREMGHVVREQEGAE